VRRNPNKPPRLGLSMLAKAAIAGLLIVLATAGAVSATVLLQVDDLVNIVENAREGRVEINIPEITPAEAGKPQTLMILGSDQRYGDKKAGLKPRSDTIILIRLDAHQQATSVMSIPRDLLVDIPGYGGPQKINGAYTLGGPRLTLRTVKGLLSTPERPFKINHVVTISFEAFQRAINYIGGVYVDIDHRYYNDNTQGGEHYATIDVPAGYQLLHGGDALDYVRYRHTDNDLVRSARQQDFLRQIRNQKGTKELMNPSLSNLRRLAKLFARYFDYDKDLAKTKQIFSLAKLVLGTASHPVREVPFDVVDAPDHVNLEASPRMIQRSVDRFFQPTSATGGDKTSGSSSAKKKSKRSGKAGADAYSNVPGLVNARTEGENQAILAARKTGFGFYYPTLRYGGGTFVGQGPRLYTIKDELNRPQRAYRLVLSAGQNEGYYGVQGLTWRNPPILDDPHTTRTIDGRKLMIYRDGNKIRLVAWKNSSGAYWVTNTLTRRLTERQIIAIALSLRRLKSK
jgi:LCP family protein required for cell wall assembly